MLTFMLIGGSGLVYLKMTHKLTPGPLASYNHNGPLGGVSSHAELDTRCLDCHAPVHCFSDSRCQECHVEIADDRADISTLHGRIPDASRCQNCHPEHRGAEAALVDLSALTIDHTSLVGYSLAGHEMNYDGSEMGCAACHAEHGSIQETLDCAGCHTEEDPEAMAGHVQDYGPRCLDCHDGQDRMLAEYDHDANLPLTGGHADLACSECHARPEARPSAACQSCHEDPEVHLGDFGLDCIRCHTDDAWTPAELRIHVFELEHAGLTVDECASCHVTTYAEYTCVSCHQSGEMQYVHSLLGIDSDQSCHSCHPTGQPGEGALPRVPDGLPDPLNQTGQQQNVIPGDTMDTTIISGKDG